MAVWIYGLASGSTADYPSGGADLLPGENDENQDNGNDIDAGRQKEHIVPVSGRRGGDRSERHQECGGALRRIEQRRIRGRVFRPEQVRTHRREQAEDLAPAKEHHSGEEYESPRISPEHIEQKITRSTEAECDRHGLGQADVIGDPSE